MAGKVDPVPPDMAFPIRHSPMPGAKHLILSLMVLYLTACAAPQVLEPAPSNAPKPPKQEQLAQQQAQPALNSQTMDQGREPQPNRLREPLSNAFQQPSIHTDLPTIQYTIQVGAFSTPDRAGAYAAKLVRLGLDAYYFIDSDGLCKVRFERFETEAEARKRASDLKARKLIDTFFIVHPVIGVDRMDPGPSLRKNIILTAGRFIGTPYRWGGESKAKGFDCSGLTMTVYRLNGLELPRSSRDQFLAGRPIKQSALQAGDLVFFATNGRRRVSHVGIYCGKGQFIHAPSSGKRIRISALSEKYFRRRFIGARRYF